MRKYLTNCKKLLLRPFELIFSPKITSEFHYKVNIIEEQNYANNSHNRIYHLHFTKKYLQPK